MNNNHKCLVCMGSNCEPELHLKNAAVTFKQVFKGVILGKSVVTEAVGTIPQPDYVNQAARFETELDTASVIKLLKEIECKNGRTPSSKEKGCVSLDIDLLAYDELKIKPEDFSKSYVKSALHLLPNE